MKDETFTFEKVSIAEARAARAGDQTTKQTDANEWAQHRQPPSPTDHKLQTQAVSWLVSLPESVRPLRLARQFPRIVNHLSTEWKRPNACDKIFDELTVDRRGNRQGFPLDLVKEISNLKSYYEAEVSKRPQDSWSISI